MFPIGDEHNGRRITPYVTYALIAINIAVFFFEASLRERDLFTFIYQWGTVPRDVSAGREYFTLLTATFLHGGWLHLAGNMLFLWVFGDNIEDTLGHVGFLLFYLLCGMAASAAQVLVDPNSAIPIVGASGAIAGVLGAYLMLFPNGNIRTVFLFIFIPFVVLIPAWIQIGLWILSQAIYGYAALSVETRATSGGVAYFAHIGGFVAGMVLVWLFKDDEAVKRQRAARANTRAFQRIGRYESQ
jgi:membrane associated rhomboid family serine protease